MMRFLSRLFRRAEPVTLTLIPVDDSCAPVLQIERALQIAREHFTPVEIRLTQNAYGRLCGELGVVQLSHVCGLPIRIVDGAHA